MQAHTPERLVVERWCAEVLVKKSDPPQGGKAEECESLLKLRQSQPEESAGKPLVLGPTNAASTQGPPTTLFVLGRVFAGKTAFRCQNLASVPPAR